jgi:putative ABC transport system permease protein
VEARVISLPSGSRAEVNDVKVEEGTYFESANPTTLLVQKSFAEHHGLEAGDTVLLATGQAETEFHIAGIVTSPEYIFAAKSHQEFMVSADVWGVVFVPEQVVPDLAGEPLVNEICLTLEDDSDPEKVMTEVETVLAPYGATEPVSLEDQPSNAALQMDLDQFGEMSEVFPLLFLIVGALATYILLTRLVYSQRSQIGVTRAIGYSRRQVLFHYVGFALIIGLAGSVAGAIAGFLLSEALTHFYVGVLGLPYTKIQLNWLAFEEGIFIGLLPCLLAGAVPAYRASRLSPAAAMRTPTPTAGRKLLLERLVPPLTRLSSLWKIPLRNIFRNRRRSLYTVVGIVFGVGLILVSAAMMDALDAYLKFQFEDVQKYDAQITFLEPQDRATQLAEIGNWEGVESAEPMLQIPAGLISTEELYDTYLVGIEPQCQLYGVYDTSGKQTSVGTEGVLLSKGLRDTLAVSVGDSIGLRLGGNVTQVPVAGFVKQTAGGYAYMSLAQAQALMGGENVINSVLVSGDPSQMDAIRETAYDLVDSTSGVPKTASVELTGDTLAAMEELLQLATVFLGVMLAFGVALAMGIVFTTVTVNILERRREIGTMRTLGEGKGRIAAMITIENLILGLAGLLPGILFGYILAVQMFKLLQTDTMTFDLVIYARTYVLTTALVIAIMLVSQLPGIRQAGRLDLAQVVKEQAD